GAPPGAGVLARPGGAPDDVGRGLPLPRQHRPDPAQGWAGARQPARPPAPRAGRGLAGRAALPRPRPADPRPPRLSGPAWGGHEPRPGALRRLAPMGAVSGRVRWLVRRHWVATIGFALAAGLASGLCLAAWDAAR